MGHRKTLRDRSICRLVAATAGILIFASATSASVFTTVVRSGQSVPGHPDLFFSKLFGPIRSADGTLAFISNVVDVSGTTTRSAGLVGRPGELQTFAIIGDVAPDSDGLRYAQYQSIKLSPGGRLAFTAGLDDSGLNPSVPGERVNRTLFYQDENRSLVRSLRSTEPLPNTTSGLPPVSSFDDAGNLSFWTGINSDTLYIYSTATHTGQQIGPPGDTFVIDGVNATPAATVIGSQRSDGSILISAPFTINNQYVNALIIGQDGVHYRSIVRTGQSAATGGDEVIKSFSTSAVYPNGRFGISASVGPPTINSGSQLGSALYESNIADGHLRLIARSGTLAPGLDDTIFKSFGINLNESGQLAILANMLDVGSGNEIRQGLFVGTLDDWHPAIVTGDMISDTHDNPLVLNSLFAGTQFNSHGQLTMAAAFKGPGINSTNDGALLAYDPTDGLHVLLREGDLFTLEDGSTKTIAVSGSGFPTGTLADDGTLTILLSFSDGTNGIFQTIVPEPTSLWIAAALLLPRRRRIA